MNRTKEQLIELIKELPDSQRNEIAEVLSTAAMAINHVEVLLIPTPLHGASLILENQSTLWCNIYALEKMFKVSTPTFPNPSTNQQ